MSLSNINAYDYEQYNAVWCKAVSLEAIQENNPKKKLNDQKIIYECIEEIHMYYTPESWTGAYQLQEGVWQVSRGEHIEIVEEIIKGAVFYRQEEKKAQIEHRDKILTYMEDFEGGFEAYQKASPEEKNRIRTHITDNWYSPANEDDLLPPVDFNEHAELKNEFLNVAFTKKARFYFNKTKVEAQKSIQEEDRENIPAVVGIDDHMAAMMWFNF